MVTKVVRRLVLAAILAGIPLAACAQPVPQPTVVELFTSQGCSSCPPANDTLGKLADRPDVLALSFGVTYWDSLGWKDTFARPEFTARQWDYAHGLHHGNVGTPQMVVDGRADTVGGNVGQVEPLIKAAQAARGSGVDIAFHGNDIRIAKASPADATVWLVWYDPRTVQVPVRAGENDGRTLPHRNVVRALIKLGAWSGKAEHFALPQAPDKVDQAAVLIQEGIGGVIIGSAKG